MGLSKACLPPFSSIHKSKRGKMNCVLCCLDLVAWRVTLYCQGRSDKVLWPLDICLPLWRYERQAGSDFLWPSSWGKCLLLGEPVALPILVSFCYPHPSKIKLKKKIKLPHNWKKQRRGRKKKRNSKMINVTLWSMLWPILSCSMYMFQCFCCDDRTNWVTCCPYAWGVRPYMTCAPMSQIIKKKCAWSGVSETLEVTAVPLWRFAWCCHFKIVLNHAAGSLSSRNLTKMVLEAWLCMEFLQLISAE